MIDARTLLGELVGRTIKTVSRGHPNVILSVEQEVVIVATERSPEGEPVPIEWIQPALDRLAAGDEVEVSVDSLGHRSAFVGAVLATVPGARVLDTRPHRIVLAKAQRNPSWRWDEEILAFDLYRRVGLADDTHPEVEALSELLRTLPIHPPEARTQTFRNPNGVARKLADIGTRDPARPERKPTSGSRLDREVWERFGERPEEAARLAGLIRAEGSTVPSPDDDDEEVERSEGRIVFRLHRRRERDRHLVERKRAEVMKRMGRLACEVCDVDLEQNWGEVGRGAFEVHHLVPLWLTGETTTKLGDLALLCPNCHRIAHRIQPWPTLSDLRALLRRHV